MKKTDVFIPDCVPKVQVQMNEKISIDIMVHRWQLRLKSSLTDCLSLLWPLFKFQDYVTIQLSPESSFLFDDKLILRWQTQKICPTLSFSVQFSALFWWQLDRISSQIQVTRLFFSVFTSRSYNENRQGEVVYATVIANWSVTVTVTGTADRITNIKI